MFFPHQAPHRCTNVARRDTLGLSNFDGDRDDFLVPVQDGQTVAAIVTPDNPLTTLSVELAEGEPPSDVHRAEQDIDGHAVVLGVRKT